MICGHETEHAYEVLIHKVINIEDSWILSRHETKTTFLKNSVRIPLCSKHYKLTSRQDRIAKSMFHLVLPISLAGVIYFSHIVGGMGWLKFCLMWIVSFMCCMMILLPITLLLRLVLLRGSLRLFKFPPLSELKKLKWRYGRKPTILAYVGWDD